jgi:nicotinamide-nucleotide amidase
MRLNTHGLPALSRTLGDLLLAQHWRVATAESCTGGGVAAAITMTPGSSAWFEYGVVSYSNTAKQTLLKVQSQTLENHGAVSEAVVLAMVAGALEISKADIAVAVSGVTGPGGGTAEKPVGSVWFAWGLANGYRMAALLNFDGDRLTIQEQAVVQALQGLVELIQKKPV